MPDKNTGLIEKYAVRRNDGKPMGLAFVLEYTRDPFAITALSAYVRAIVGYPIFDLLRADLNRIIADAQENGIHCRLDCPSCGGKHVDRDEWATRKHKTHLCEGCGHEWRPFSDFPTFGIEK